MVIDSSAVLAILLQEEDAKVFSRTVEEHTFRFLSAVSYVEVMCVAEGRKGRLGEDDIIRFFRDSGVSIVPFDESMARVAVKAFQRFGKGRHPAQLNFGDCMVYALARSLNQPILCKGNDFRQTDIACLP
ncbi:MAG: type II toxin-antitoxin system VapC family toxin [Acidobacteriaceae bacterium]